MTTVQRGARLRRSPFYEATQRHDPKGFTVYNHTLFPINFDDFEAEYWHLLNHVTLWDVAVERNVEVTGPDGFQLRAAAHLPRPQRVRGRPGQVRADHGAGRRDPQRPGHAAAGREHVLVRARRQRRAAVREGAGGARGDGRAALRGRGVPAADPGPEVEGRRAGPVRRRDPRPALLPLPPPRAGRHPADPHPHRLDVGGRIRDLPPRRLARNGPVGPDHGGGRAVRDPADGAGGHPPDRGRHLQLGRRHDVREQPVRAGPRPARRPGHRARTSSPATRSRGFATRA